MHRFMLALALAGCADNLVHGRATVDGDARPVGDAFVVIQAADGRHVARTDDDGRFSIATPVGFWRSELHVAGGIYAPFLIGPLVSPSSNAKVECTSCSPLLHPTCPRDSHVATLAAGDAEAVLALELQRIDLFRKQMPDAAFLPNAGPIWLIDARAGVHGHAHGEHYWLTMRAKLRREAERSTRSIPYVFVAEVSASNGCANVIVGIGLAAPKRSPQLGAMCCCSTHSIWTKRDDEWLYVGDASAACA
jgi:hypothetical protein